MDDMTVWQGSQVPITVTQGDDDSVSATIILVLQDGSVSETITKTANFEEVDGKMVADLTLDAEDTATAGTYSYQILENFDDADPLIYPDPENCEGDDGCDLPTLTICESLVDDVS